MRRLIIVIFACLFVLGTASLAGLSAVQENRDVNTSIVIDADLATVWKVLGDTMHYSDWSPFIREFSGDVRTGGLVGVTLEIPEFGSRTYEATLIGYMPEHELIWEHDLPIPRLFTVKHKLIIDPDASGGVRLRHEGEFSGLLVGPFTAFYLDWYRSGFEAMNQELKKRVEGDRS